MLLVAVTPSYNHQVAYSERSLTACYRILLPLVTQGLREQRVVELLALLGNGLTLLHHYLKSRCLQDKSS